MTAARIARRVSDAADAVTVRLCIGLTVVMLAISILGIGHQAVTGTPLVWSYSLARLFLPWVAMLSIAVALKRGEHVALTFVVARLPEPWRQACAWLAFVVLVAFAAALVWFGSGFFLGSTQLYMVSDSLQVSGRWMAASVPAAGVVLLLHALTGPRILAVAPADGQ